MNQAFRAARCGDGDVFIAGGVGMSRAPYSMPRGQPPQGRKCNPLGHLQGGVLTPRWSDFPLEAMGCTAENIVDRMDISRADQDAFALASHTKALDAQAGGAFDAEIGRSAHPKADARPWCLARRRACDTSLERLGKLDRRFATEVPSP